MNNLYSQPEIYLERWLTPELQTAVREHPILVLTGARQVGKSTLLRHASPFAQWRYHTLDNFDVLQQAQEEPHRLWVGTNEVILDEVQKVPGVLSAVKQAVDQNPQLRFVLSGSANLLLMRQVSETLAGRAVYFTLAPMTFGEINHLPATTLLPTLLAGQFPPETVISPPSIDLPTTLLRGFMPRLLTITAASGWVRWWEGYVATYLERDLRQVSQIDSLIDFRRVMAFLALRTGQLLNQSELARDAGLSQSTIHRYMNLLEATYLFERLPAYTASYTTRLLKSPRLYWLDPGLAVFLAGYFDVAALQKSRELGSFFETLIFHHLHVLAGLLTPRARLYFWRTQTGDEVDFVLEYGRKLLAIEVKMTDNPGYRHTEGLKKFLAAYPDTMAGVLLHGGTAVRQLDKKIVAIPWSVLTG